MEYRVLGPLEVRDGDRPLALGGTQQRALLALLLLNANRVVSRQRLIDELWGDEPPESAVKTIQVYVSRLRKLLPAEALLTRPPGYRLETGPDLDLLRFERLCGEARNANPERASRLLREALELWRGPAFEEFAEPFARLEGRRLDGLRLAAREERIEADLALGRHQELVGELEGLTAEHPHRERLRVQLMLALYRSGRHADALEAYRAARAALDDLGIEPSATLRQLEKQILTQDPTLDPTPGRLLARPAGDPVPLPVPLLPASPFAFVGRSHELATLRALLKRAEGGEGALVLLSGEAGAGKTRLMREFAHEAAAGGVLTLYGISDAVVSTPYQPLREWLDFLLRVCTSDGLAKCLGDGTLAKLVPELEEVAGTPAMSVEEPDRYALQTAATKLLSRLSRTQPLLVVVDDLQWSDAETLHLLRRLARVAPGDRMVVVAAFRDPGEEIGPELADTLADLSRIDAVARLQLGNLSADEVREFIGVSTDAEVTGELAAEIGELSDGTPLLLCELWRDLRDSGAVEVRRSVFVSQPVAELRGPRRIRDVVRQRMFRLRRETRALLEAAAVAGPRFESPVLGRASGLEPIALVPHLDEAATAGLLEALPEPDVAWRFTHELVRRAIYDRLDRAHRTELHLRVAEALEQEHAADPVRVLPELAHHFTLAAPVAGVDRAVEYNLRAAHAAIASAAYEEAAARFTSALELGIADARERMQVQVELADLLDEAGQVRDAAVLFDESLSAARALGDRGAAARILLHRARAGMERLDVDPAQLQAVAEEAMETFKQLGDARGVADAERHIAHALRRRGRLGAARDALERALAAADASGDRLVRRQAIGSLCFVLWLGPAPAHEAIARCEELIESNPGDPALQAAVSRSLSALYAMTGRFDEAREQLERSGPILDKLNVEAQTWVYRQAAAEAKELMGDRLGAEQELIAQWQRFSGAARMLVALQAAHRLALMYCDDGRWDDAERCVAYGRDAPEPTYFTQVRAIGLAARARLAAYRGSFEEALALARRGVEVADESDMLNVRARVWLALAEVQRERGEPGDAETAVASALDLYQQKGNIAAVASLVQASGGRAAG